MLRCKLTVAERVTPVKIRRYYDLKHLKTFEERYDYLKLSGIVGQSTFGYDRWLNQVLYRSKKWKQTRDGIIVRDNGCDLGCSGYTIHGSVIVHHMNPITIDDIELDNEMMYDPEFLICTTDNTHNAIHYGNSSLLPKAVVERQRNDTCPWKH